MIDFKPAVLVMAVCLASGESSMAQEAAHEGNEADATREHSANDMDSGKMSMEHGMMRGMGGEMQDDREPMDGGMKKCQMMQGGAMRGMDGMMERMIHIPTLPPGNEKLQLMMQAEILQKVGEVEAKYAAQIKGNQTP
jgi:hypothetical protein